MHKYGPVIKMLSLVTQIGITMLTSVFGIMGGIRGVYSLIHNILEQEDMEDKDER